MNSNDELYHYGVKGMQWGVRNERKYNIVNNYIRNKKSPSPISTKNHALSVAKYKYLKGKIKLDNSLKKEQKAEQKAEKKADKKVILGGGYGGASNTVLETDKGLRELYGTTDTKEINSRLSPTYNYLNRVDTVRKNLDTMAKNDGASPTETAKYDNKTMTVGITYVNSNGAMTTITIDDPSLKKAAEEYRDHIDKMDAMNKVVDSAKKPKAKGKKKQQKSSVLVNVKRSGYGGYYE